MPPVVCVCVNSHEVDQRLCGRFIKYKPKLFINFFLNKVELKQNSNSTRIKKKKRF